MEHPGQQRAIDQCRATANQTQVDSPAPLLGEYHLTKAADTLFQETQVVMRLQTASVGIQRLGTACLDIDAAEALDVEQPRHVQHVNGVVGAEGNRSRYVTKTDTVVQEFEMNALVTAANPSEKTLGMPA